MRQVAGITAGCAVIDGGIDTFKVAAEFVFTAARLDCRIAGLAFARDAIFVFALAVSVFDAIETGSTQTILIFTAGGTFTAQALDLVVIKTATISLCAVAAFCAAQTYGRAQGNTFKVAAKTGSSAARLVIRIAGFAFARDAIFVFALAVSVVAAFDTGSIDAVGGIIARAGVVFAAAAKVVLAAVAV